MTDTEAWKDVPGWEGVYQVSDAGRVRSLDRVALRGVRGGKSVQRFYPGQILDQVGTRYAKVSLTAPGRREQPHVHVLVLTAFARPPLAGEQCRHLDDDKRNNRLANLRWGTPAENVADAYRNAKRPTGDDHPPAVLNAAAVREIRRSPASNKALAARFGVGPAAVWAARTGRTWNHVKETTP